MAKKGYNLRFCEAVETCLKDKGFIRGTNFASGVYVREENGVLVVIKKMGYSHEKIEPFKITSNTVEQKYKVLNVVSDEELGL